MADLESSVAAARALGHPARLRSMAMLLSGELCVCQITEVLGLAPSTVSAHLKELKQAGLIAERKDGKWVYFGLTDTAKTQSWLTAALANLESDPQLEHDRQLVEELRRMPVEELCRYGYEAAKSRALISNIGLPTTEKELP